MNLFSVAFGNTQSEFQIQKNIEKLRFRITAGAKLTTVPSALQLLTDAALIVVTLKRHSASMGEKTVWPRCTLLELLNSTLGMEGFAKVTGTDAATVYTADFSIEASALGNIDVAGGDYLALTVENGAAAGTVYVDGQPGFVKTNDHNKMTKIALQATDSKRVLVDRADFVVIPLDVAECRIVGDDTVTLNATTLSGYLTERSAFIVNTDGGSFALPTAAVLPANNIDYIDFTNGATARNILIWRQTSYNN